MAREVNKQIPSGQGSSNPGFGIDVNLSTPGVANVPQQNSFAQLTDVLLNGLGSVAAGLRSAGEIQGIIEHKKEQVLHQQDQELAETAQTLEQQRVTKAKQQQRDLLLDERAANPDWLMAQARTKLDNAATEPEKELWFRVTAAAQDQLQQKTKEDEREAKRQKIEDINLAGLAASRVITQMNINLKEDSALQQELIGDGQGITKRVQDWVLSKATEASPETFKLPGTANKDQKQARDRVMAQLLSQSLNMADNLTEQYVKQRDGANESHAVESLDALMLGIQKGESGTDDDVRSTLKFIDQNFLGHRTTSEKEEFKRQYLQRAVQDAATLTFAQDVNQANKAINTFLANSDLPEAEQTRARERANDLMQKSVFSQFQGEVDNSVASKTVLVPAPGGGTQSIQIPDTNPIGTLSQEDSFGVSKIRRIADSYLEKIGLGVGRTDLSPSESGIRQNVLEQVLQTERQGAAMGHKAATLQEKGDAARKNLSNGDSLSMYKTNPMFLARSPEGVAGNADIMGTFALAGATDVQWGETPEVPLGVGPVAMIPETRPARTIIAQQEASKWDDVTVHSFPSEMLDDFTNKMRSKNPEDMFDVVQFSRSLSHDGKEEFLKKFGAKLELPELLAFSNLSQAAQFRTAKEWDSEYEEAITTMKNDHLTEKSLNSAALNQYSQIIQNTEVGFKPEARSIRDQNLGLIVGYLNADAATQNLGGIVGVNNTSGQVEAPDTSKEFQDALTQSTGWTNTDLTLLAGRFQALKDQGMDDMKAAAGVKSWLHNDGYDMAAWGGRLRLIKNGSRVLGNAPLTETRVKDDITAFLTAKPPTEMLKDAATRFNIKPGTPVNTMFDLMRAVDPKGFGSMAGEALPDFQLNYDDETWQKYSNRPNLPSGEPGAVAVLRFKDNQGVYRPIMFNNQVVSVYSDFLKKKFKIETPKRPVVQPTGANTPSASTFGVYG